MLLASQITWSENCDNALAKIDAGGSLNLMQDVLLQVYSFIIHVTCKSCFLGIEIRPGRSRDPVNRGTAYRGFAVLTCHRESTAVL